MGKVGKAIWNAVCNALYSNIKNGPQIAENDEAVKQIDENIHGEGEENGIEDIAEDIVQYPKNAEKQEAEEKEAEKEDARDITNQQATTARKAAYQAAIDRKSTRLNSSHTS